jgi:hypothetical protein
MSYSICSLVLYMARNKTTRLFHNGVITNNRLELHEYCLYLLNAFFLFYSQFLSLNSHFTNLYFSSIYGAMVFLAFSLWPAFCRCFCDHLGLGVLVHEGILGV